MLELINVKTFWQDAEVPHFLERTPTKYSESPLKVLEDRGIKNELFNSLVSGLPDGAYIAGGFVTSVMQEDKQATDIDIFFTSEKAFKDTYERLKDPSKELDEKEQWAWLGYKLETNETEFIRDSKKYRFVKFVHPKHPPIQLVKLVWYTGPEHIIDSFDLTIAQFAASKTSLYFNPLSPMDLVRKRIVLHRMQFPVSTLRRLIKYSSKGYYACPGALTEIAKESASVLERIPGSLGLVVYVD